MKGKMKNQEVKWEEKLSQRPARRTRREVVPLVALLRLAVEFLLSELVQQTLVLVLLSRQGRPLLGEVCNAAGAVALTALEKEKRCAGTITKIQWPARLSTVNRLDVGTFAVPVLPFVPPAATLAGGFAAGGEVGLGGRLAATLVGLRDGRRVGRVGHAAEAFQ